LLPAAAFACSSEDFEISPEVIETDRGPVRWDEHSFPTTDLAIDCRSHRWSFRLCASGADWTRRIVIASVQAEASSTARVRLTVTPPEEDSTFAGSNFERDVGVEPAIMQVYGEIGYPEFGECGDYMAVVEVEGGATVSVTMHIAAFVEIGGVASFDAEEMEQCE
jgi:hypothetical protein